MIDKERELLHRYLGQSEQRLLLVAAVELLYGNPVCMHACSLMPTPPRMPHLTYDDKLGRMPSSLIDGRVPRRTPLSTSVVL
jgi:hypothetical protein